MKVGSIVVDIHDLDGSADAVRRGASNATKFGARIFDETPDVKTFRLVAPGGGSLPFDHLAGQYLNLALTIDGKRVNRSYTIASSPTRADYRPTLKLKASSS